MNKIAVVYWSGSGNTEAMAHAVGDGITQAGAEATILQVNDFSAEALDSYDAVIFGCPAMGAEELEEYEFAPVFDECEGKLNGVTIALFGSYGWGSGEWMSAWQDRCLVAGAKVIATVTAQNSPDADAIAACNKLGSAVATAL